MRRKENQEELIMMTHQAPLQVMKKKQIYVKWQDKKVTQAV